MTETQDLRYPIGRFHRPVSLTTEERTAAAATLAETPARLREAVAGLTPAQLDTPYRPGGWTVRQLVHHVPDSHLNAYVRLKLALTEDEPTIRPYHEDRWAQLPEARSAPLEPSLALLESLHQRWDLALRDLAPADWQRTLVHPESGRQTVEQLIALYAWHGRHHTAHVAELRRREGWI
ncbi:MAG TPA: putative metal-dependent hydrolase [Thermoanaerobaculia bacterium]|nr:putative metal-dependent hydrolase [Thermoanaerobaculia bacterium]